ncbi:hypothetical protein EKO27_g11977 [Xylaria grammica]|uniref:Uncharacterized protein n=1 Tax=Xylaria grammica TaxID=363999 RepID=A0A439CLT4_9PEZI|nr:hypothetical protein EKO27_g11977 [Xylaria grammica]
MVIDRAKWRVTIYREAEATATLQLDYDTSGGTARGYDCHFEHALKVEPLSYDGCQIEEGITPRITYLTRPYRSSFNIESDLKRRVPVDFTDPTLYRAYLMGTIRRIAIFDANLYILRKGIGVLI